MVEKEYIERDCSKCFHYPVCDSDSECACYISAADVVEVVRCKDCIYAVPFDRNCEFNTSAYLHCGLLRGEEVKYVWHKYKKYYKDYSVVDRDGFCDSGEKMNGGNKNG